MFKPFGCFVGSSVKVLDKSVMALPTAPQVTLPARPRPRRSVTVEGDRTVFSEIMQIVTSAVQVVCE